MVFPLLILLAAAAAVDRAVDAVDRYAKAQPEPQRLFGEGGCAASKVPFANLFAR